MKVAGKVAIVTGGGGGIGGALVGELTTHGARDVLAAIDEERFLILQHAKLRPLAARDAPLPGLVADRQSMTIPLPIRSPHVPV
jgi:NAD(P)-dependent dehydrogenase (short-subunit alcohol dehydrogenase family)